VTPVPTLKEHREALGLSQTAAGARIGADKSRISRLERKGGDMHVRTLHSFARAYGLTALADQLEELLPSLRSSEGRVAA
jgi:transcriptional regulator with XRE-family HTH domain